MLSTAPIPHLSVLNKTGKLFHECRRLGSYGKLLTIRSSSSVQEIKKPSVSSGSSDERRELLPNWESIALPPVQAANRVVLVRHGQSTWNAEGRIQGSSDFSVLTNKGESQAETSLQMLLDDSFDLCFSSPLIRSKRTAEIIWGSRKEEIITESDLREIDLYSFQVSTVVGCRGNPMMENPYSMVDPPDIGGSHMKCMILHRRIILRALSAGVGSH